MIYDKRIPYESFIALKTIVPILCKALHNATYIIKLTCIKVVFFFLLFLSDYILKELQVTKKEYEIGKIFTFALNTVKLKS